MQVRGRNHKIVPSRALPAPYASRTGAGSRRLSQAKSEAQLEGHLEEQLKVANEVALDAPNSTVGLP